MQHIEPEQLLRPVTIKISEAKSLRNRQAHDRTTGSGWSLLRFFPSGMDGMTWP